MIGRRVFIGALTGGSSLTILPSRRVRGVSGMVGYGNMAAMVKVTFTLDDQTVERLRRTASRLAKPQSYVVREAVREYEMRSTKLSDEERERMLATVDRMVQERPTRTAAEVDAELGEIRGSRRRWGRGRAGPRRR